jgi:hypothetical protein
MKLIKAVCQCSAVSETNTVLAIEQGRLAFMDAWGFFTWTAVLVMILFTGGFWVGLIFGWHIKDIVNPKYRCNQCESVILPKDFR